MADQKKDFELEHSTFEYFTNREVRVATESLLNSGTEELPPGVSWDDVPRFYAALRAASLIKIDYAISLERFWTAVWKELLIPSKWKELSPDDQGQYDEDAENSVDECFDEKRYIRCFRFLASKYIFYASVAISETGFALGFDLYKGAINSHLIRELEGFRFKKGDGLWTDPSQTRISRTPDLVGLRELARAAARAAEQRVT